MRRPSIIPLALLALAPAGCDTIAGTAPGTVEVRLGVQAAAPGTPGAAAVSHGDSLVIAGDNGTLTITALKAVVAEFRLKHHDDDPPCAGDDCDWFEAGPFFVDLALDERGIAVAGGDVPAGVYRALRFEIEDLDDDEEDPAMRARIDALWTQIRAAHPSWPRKASMLIEGHFRPSVGEPRPFRVYAEAEVEYRITLQPALVVEGDDRTVAVLLDPGVLFRRSGQVTDLSQWNGRLLEFETELREGVVVRTR